MSAKIRYPVCFEGFRRRVWIAEAVAGIWISHRQTDKHKPEAFGVLIGTTTLDKRELWIEAVTTPMGDDDQSRCHFQLKDSGHQLVVDNAFQEFEGGRIYLGTWHTHPAERPIPSRVDKADWRQCLKRNKGRPLVFVIAGTLETRVFVPWGKGFRSLKECEEIDVE